MEIIDIKRNLSLTDVLRLYGLSPDRNGRICCPFHDDKTPSMQIYPKTDTAYCFSSNCTLHRKAIDQIDFIKYKDGISKYLALRKATELAMKSQPSETKSTHNNMTPNPPLSDLNKLFRALRQKYYRGSLAQDYAKERHLDYKKLELGFNPYSFSEYKPLKNCLVFPLRDVDDNVVSLYGRSVAKNPRSKHFYSKNRSGLYPGYPGTDTKTIIICEAPIDTATMQSHGGNKNQPILSLYGTNGWTEEHTTAIKRIENLEEVIFFLDGDPAGEKAVETYSGLVKALTSQCKISRVHTPESEDVNSLLDSHDPEILQHLIDSRTFLFSSGSLDRQSKDNLSFSSEKGSFEKEREASKITATQNDEEANDLKTAQKEAPKTEGSPSEPASLNDNNPEYIQWTSEQLYFRVLGKISLFPVDKLLLTLEVSKIESADPRHKIRQRINMYDDDKLEKLSDKIAERMNLSMNTAHGSLIRLADLLTNHRSDRIKLESEEQPDEAPMSIERRKEVLAFLKQDGLIKKTNALIGKTGLIGEERNRMIIWLIYTSRLRNEPLHVMCLGASGTGKTYLQEKVSALIPDNDKLEITAMSDNSVYYFDQEELKHKLVLIEDLDGANEEKVMYALRELMSKKRISKKVVIKDNQGQMRTITLKVEGPICLSGTTTRERLYEDNANRSILIYLDQSAKQREKIMEYQCRKSANMIDRVEQEKIKMFLQDVQRVIRNVRVVNPYAIDIKLPAGVFKPLRTNKHYLEVIENVTFYHQFQREVKTDSQNSKYIETTIDDIKIANALIHEVLLAKSDELTKACRGFFERIKGWLSKEEQTTFYRNQIRTAFRMNPNNVKYYLNHLVNYGFVKIVGGNRYKSGYEYEVVNLDEYEKLSGNLKNALDIALEGIKKKYEPKTEALSG